MSKQLEALTQSNLHGEIMNLTSKEERSLLVYFETQAMDYGGTLESARMNGDDFALAKRWHEAGFIQFGRIAFKDIKRLNGVARDHWVVLSDKAWSLAHAERRARCDRVMAALKVERKGLLTNEPVKSKALRAAHVELKIDEGGAA